MQSPLVVITAQELRSRTRWLKVLFWPFALLCIYGVVALIRRGEPDRMGELAMYAVGIPFFSIAPYFLYALQYRDVKVFDTDGVTTRMGKRYLWANFVRVEDRQRPRIGHNHYELFFEGGMCTVADLLADNYNELREVVASLEAGKNPFTGEALRTDKLEK